MEIKILGSGCKNCKVLQKNTEDAVKELGIKANIEKVSDIAKIMEYGVMSTPAIVVDEKVISYGKVLNSGEIKKLLE